MERVPINEKSKEIDYESLVKEFQRQDVEGNKSESRKHKFGVLHQEQLVKYQKAVEECRRQQKENVHVKLLLAEKRKVEKALEDERERIDKKIKQKKDERKDLENKIRSDSQQFRDNQIAVLKLLQTLDDDFDGERLREKISAMEYLSEEWSKKLKIAEEKLKESIMNSGVDECVHIPEIQVFEDILEKESLMLQENPKVIKKRWLELEQNIAFLEKKIKSLTNEN